MKSFFVSLCFFALLITAIVCNCVFVKGTVGQMQERLQELQKKENALQGVIELEAFWQEREGALALSVSYDKLCEMRTQLAQLRVAAAYSEAAELERARLLALNVLEQIGRPEQLSLRAIF